MTTRKLTLWICFSFRSQKKPHTFMKLKLLNLEIKSRTFWAVFSSLFTINLISDLDQASSFLVFANNFFAERFLIKLVTLKIVQTFLTYKGNRLKNIFKQKYNTLFFNWMLSVFNKHAHKTSINNNSQKLCECVS